MCFKISDKHRHVYQNRTEVFKVLRLATRIEAVTQHLSDLYVGPAKAIHSIRKPDGINWIFSSTRWFGDLGYRVGEIYRHVENGISPYILAVEDIDEGTTHYAHHGIYVCASIADCVRYMNCSGFRQWPWPEFWYVGKFQVRPADFLFSGDDKEYSGAVIATYRQVKLLEVTPFDQHPEFLGAQERCIS